MAVPGSCPSSERRGTRSADDLTALAPAIAEAVGHGACEIVGVPGPEDAGLAADRHLDLAGHDDAAFLADVAQHVGARVGAWLVGLAQDRQAAPGPVGRDEAERYRPFAELDELFLAVEDLGRARRAHREDLSKAQ